MAAVHTTQRRSHQRLDHRTRSLPTWPEELCPSGGACLALVNSSFPRQEEQPAVVVSWPPAYTKNPGQCCSEAGSLTLAFWPGWVLERGWGISLRLRRREYGRREEEATLQRYLRCGGARVVFGPFRTLLKGRGWPESVWQCTGQHGRLARFC